MKLMIRRNSLKIILNTAVSARRSFAFLIGLTSLMIVSPTGTPGSSTSALAQDEWRPFAAQDRDAARRKARRRQRTTNSRRTYGSQSRSGSSSSGAPLTGRDAAVQSEELAPLAGADPGNRPTGNRPSGNRPSDRAYARQPAANGGRSSGSSSSERENSWETYRTVPPAAKRRRASTQPRPPRDAHNKPRDAYNIRNEQSTGFGRQDDYNRSNAPAAYTGQDAAAAQSGPRRSGGQITRPARALPGDIWRGLSSKQIENLVAGLTIPPRSPVLHSLWRRLWLSSARPQNDGTGAEAGASRTGDTAGSFAGDDGPVRAQNYHDALALEALYRSGLVGDVAAATTSRAGRDERADPLLATLHARALIGLGKRRRACDLARRSIRPNAAMPQRIKGQALLVLGYCAAAANRAEAAGLTAELAREEKVRAPLALAVMQSVAGGTKPRLEVPERMTLLSLRFLQLVSSADITDTLPSAEPAVLGALALDEKSKPALRLAAGERAAAIHAITADTLADVYRAQRFNRADIADPLPTKSRRPKRRALLFQAIELARAPRRRAEYMRALLQLARRDRLHFIIAKMLLRPLADMRSGGLGAFSQTATEIAVTGGDYQLARRWAAGSNRGRLDHWMALVDIADPEERNLGGGWHGADLPALSRLAERKAFKSADLHRLATVLDALEYNVPIPLWEAASRTPQPAKGYLPKTGVLPRLGNAAKRGEIGHTALLALRTIGPKGAYSAHMIGLGDTIRALRTVGLKGDARRLAFEALIDFWPRRQR